MTQKVLNTNSAADKLRTMFAMQEALNAHTNGPDYKETQICAKTGKPINYRRCAWMETAEFVDSFDWKHWKHGKDDIENAKTELVDIWHFILGAVLVENLGAPNTTTIEHAAKLILEKSAPVSGDAAYLYETSEDFIVHTLNKTNKMFPELGEPLSLMQPFGLFFEMCDAVGLSFNELYQRYIIKNTLNKFRQDNGYAEGNYIKIWHEGKEDNVFAVEAAMLLGDALSADTLYEELLAIYIELVKRGA